MAGEADVDALASAANSVANDWSNQAEGFVDTLESLANTVFTPTLVNPRLPLVFSGRDSEMRTAIDGQAVKPTGLTFASPADPGASPTVSIRDATEVAVPTFSESSPVLDLPTRPDQVTPDKPTAPVLKSVNIPSSPTLSLPVAPSLGSVTFPDAVSIQLPDFVRSFPDDQDFLLQTTRFEFSEEIPDIPTLDAAEALMLSDLQNGGYGINPDDEDALWERARDRELRQAQAAEGDVFAETAARGFALPPGAAAAASRQAHADAMRNISEANREIVVARADLLRKAREFAVNQGTAIANVRLQHAGFRMERALNAARFSAEFAISVHDAGVRAYNARVEAYQAYISGYGARLQAELTKVQIYSEQVRAAVEQQRSQQIEVDLYRALIDASQAEIGLYETQVRAAATELDAERMKMEVFRSQIEVFATEVRANAVEFDAYEAGVRGELAKSQVFQSQVDAFRTQVQAAGVESDIRNRQVQVDIEKARAELAGYTTAVEAYRARIAAETTRVDALLREYGADTEQYAAAMRAWEGLVRVSIADNQTLATQFAHESEIAQANARLQLEAKVEQSRSRFLAANSGTEVAKSFAAMAGESLGMISAKITEVSS